MENLFGTKQLYEACIKTTSSVKVGNKVYDKGEVIARFESIEIAAINEEKTIQSAVGGHLNKPQVVWSETREIGFTFSKGIFSARHLAIASNSEIIEKTAGEIINIPISEFKETDIEGKIELENIPVGDFFCYKIENGNRILPTRKEDKVLFFDVPYIDILVDYSYNYTNRSKELYVGRKLLSAPVKIEGKIRVKEIDGTTKTGILTIPKLYITSDLSMRLGEKSTISPMVNVFSGFGVPIGERGREFVYTLALLDDDLQGQVESVCD